MRFRFLLLPLLALVFVAAAKKPPIIPIRFHLQANPVEGPSFVMEIPLVDGRKITVKKVPEISEGDITAIYPFPAGDGSMGCALKLDQSGRIRLETFSVEERGRVLVAMVNFRVVTAMLVDKPSRDGIIYIPSGMMPEEIEKLKLRYPIIGQAPTKKKK